MKKKKETKRNSLQSITLEIIATEKRHCKLIFLEQNVCNLLNIFLSIKTFNKQDMFALHIEYDSQEFSRNSIALLKLHR